MLHYGCTLGFIKVRPGCRRDVTRGFTKVARGFAKVAHVVLQGLEKFAHTMSHLVLQILHKVDHRLHMLWPGGTN